MAVRIRLTVGMRVLTLRETGAACLSSSALIGRAAGLYLGLLQDHAPAIDELDAAAL